MALSRWDVLHCVQEELVASCAEHPYRATPCSLVVWEASTASKACCGLYRCLLSIGLERVVERVTLEGFVL